MAIAVPPANARVFKRPRREEDIYPDSDGEPMGETDWHIVAMLYLMDALKRHFAQRPDVYVAADNFLYFQKGNCKAVVSPDCYVVFGAEKRLRRTYMVWKEGGVKPSVVFEVTSKSTQQRDLINKRHLYARLGVAEYFLFDPTGEYLEPRLQGFRLARRRYQRILLKADRLYSQQLDLELRIEGELLRLYDPVAGANLLTSSELAERAEAQKRQAQYERQRADTLEAEVARLRAEVESLKRQNTGQKDE